MKALWISFVVWQPFDCDRREAFDQFLESGSQSTFNHGTAGADFNAKKEIWDLVIVPFWRSPSASPYADVELAQNYKKLQKLFASPKGKQGGHLSKEFEELEESFEHLYYLAEWQKLDSLPKVCAEKEELKREIEKLQKPTRERDPDHDKKQAQIIKEKSEKMEVHVFLKKNKGQTCLEPEEGYVEAAKQALQRLKKEVRTLGSQNNLFKEVQKVTIPEVEVLTDLHYTILAKIIHLLEAEAAHAKELLEHDLRRIDEAQKLFAEIQGVDQLSDGQRKQVVNLVRRLQPKVADILLNPIESEESLQLKYKLFLSLWEEDNQAEEQQQRKLEEEQRKLEEGQRELAEVNQALDWLSDKNRHAIPEAQALIRELHTATKMSDDQKERLKALKTQQSSAIRMHTTLGLPMALLWWSGCLLSDGMSAELARNEL